MTFYFDESGDFSVPSDPTNHTVSVVMGVTISELTESNLKEEFKNFIKNLDSSELYQGEPKGSLLSTEHRYQFCDLLNRFDGISLTPVTLDLSSLSKSIYTQLNESLADLLGQHADRMVYDTAKEELRLLSKQHNNLSPQQALRIYSVACSFQEALRHSILFLSTRGHENCWDNLVFMIDRTHQKPNNREEQIFSYLILAWSVGWSQAEPIQLIQEIHTKEHPFMKNFDTSKGIDIGKIIKNNVYWEDSKDNWGLQIADIASNIVFRAASNLGSNAEDLSIYALLMRSCNYGYIRGPGLFTPLGKMSKDMVDKFKPLCNAMKGK